MKVQSEPLRIVDDGVKHACGKCLRRVDGDAVTRVNASTLDMLHDARNDDCHAIAYTVNLDLRPLHIAVDEYRMIRRDLDRTIQVVAQFLLLINDFHGSAAKHVRWTHHDRIADGGGAFDCSFYIGDAETFGARNVRLAQHFLEALTIFCTIDIVHGSAEDMYASFLQ